MTDLPTLKALQTRIRSAKGAQMEAKAEKV